MGESQNKTTESMTGRTESMTARTTRAGERPQPATSLTASAYSDQRIDEFRRHQAARAIARIHDCYRRGLAIPDVR
jgi:hypothetical protein